MAPCVEMFGELILHESTHILFIIGSNVNFT